ncbi:hypothetical protein ACFVVC_04295 [Pseudarthrobacter sp. NPDC058196]|uniref:hypothetical protein n=1 Tax=Pseudarthrobacter sp. NPDC058196 TaxID=3346376 RepID=UPI0036DC7A05
MVPFERADPGCRVDQIRLVQHPEAGAGERSEVMPGGFDQQFTGMVLPALVIGP